MRRKPTALSMNAFQYKNWLGVSLRFLLSIPKISFYLEPYEYLLLLGSAVNNTLKLPFVCDYSQLVLLEFVASARKTNARVREHLYCYYTWMDSYVMRVSVQENNTRSRKNFCFSADFVWL